MKRFVNLIAIFILTNALFAEKIVFNAGSMSGQAGDSSATTTLSNGAFIQTSSMEISADTIELSGDDYRFIKATGNIVGKNLETKMEFTCDSMNYDRETKVALLQGNVSLTDTENDVKAKAQIIEYNQNTNIAVLQIEINLTQKNNVCTGSYAVYQKNEQMLEISGNAQVKQDKDTFRAQQITLNLDTQNITLSGNVKGTVTDSGKKEQTESAKKTEQKTEPKTEQKTETEEKKE